MSGLPAQRVRTLLAGGCALLVGGVIGLTWCVWRVRSRPSGRRLPGAPGSSVRHVLVAALALLLVLVGVGIVWRSRDEITSFPACRAPTGEQPRSSNRPLDAPLVAEKVVTWPETGLGLLYADALHGAKCFYQPAHYYLDFHSGRYAGARIVNVGDVTLSPPFDTGVHSGDEVADHEARHRSQWAVVTAIAGPLAFPILYGIDDFFFPGSRNHFERLAGLNAGGYRHNGVGPVIGWPQRLVLIAAAGLITTLAWRRLHRKHR